MRQEERTVCFDRELKIEAYRFKGIMQKFPNHFHEHYVIGFIEKGQRYLSCKNKEYTTSTGDLLLFNPFDSHTCEQIDDKVLDYRCINIKPEIMKKTVFEITGKNYLPKFNQPVIFRSELVPLLQELHYIIMEEELDFKKEELFFFLIEQLIEEHTEPNLQSNLENTNIEIQAVCDYLENNYAEHIILDELSTIAGMNKYSLLRNFTKLKGITPYRYLENIRVNKAKKLLEKGVEPIDAAIQTGFVDQSHFTNFFKNFIGLTPKQYQNIFINDDSNNFK
ncbi:TPA: AraC family transcriptional regulator [Clostridioides difficile]|uniref:AraC family transcriptional regulator n=4 Tax=Bacteria TaxID=2 RepID=A0A9X8RFM7_CLODI|nr:AraC family transcriptional regulator [Clostridioides difficile]EQG61634.1 bacterial regulatory helix-turn-helix s, AraC family protein [Clostridioides difficile DA00149]EQI40838.1 bacterial regulatory helix-turn-helix s, AraC family protein [Clostridioides difficile Y184]EQK92815.1 bacterial regulatory helix-turn-helix s, AraC family protein [Clostridioides difficile CD127]OFU06292.1 AraC family transcriptional regulator [Clostridium sp. HMSC19D02]OFU06540.1 AraC family transcriptional reg